MKTLFIIIFTTIRLIFACILASIAAGTALGFISRLSHLLSSGGFWGAPSYQFGLIFGILGGPGLVIFIAPIALLPCLLTTYLAHKYYCYSPSFFMTAGGLLGALFGVPLMFANVITGLGFLLAGAAGGYVYYLVGFWTLHRHRQKTLGYGKQEKSRWPPLSTLGKVKQSPHNSTKL